MSAEQRPVEPPAGFVIVPPNQRLAEDELSIYPHYVYLTQRLRTHLGHPKRVLVLAKPTPRATVYCICPAPIDHPESRRLSDGKIAVRLFGRDSWPSAKSYFRLTCQRDDTPAIYFTVPKEATR